MTRAQYQNGSVPRPFQLFSHSDQVFQHHTCRSDQIVLSGWGGRISDEMTNPANPTGLVPTISSFAGTQLFTIGENTQPVSLAPAPTPLSNVLSLIGYTNTPITNARFEALNAGLNLDGEQELIYASNRIHRQALQISQSLNNNAGNDRYISEYGTRQSTQTSCPDDQIADDFTYQPSNFLLSY